MEWIREKLEDQLEKHDSFEEEIYSGGALSKKQKRLCGVVASSLARDRQGLKENIEKAKEEGADEAEISGALSSAWMTSGSTQIYWAQDLFEEQIEHSWYKRRLKEASKAFGKFHKAVMEEGPLEEDFMEVLCMVVACMERCKHCTDAHIQQALDKGATKDQLAEALGVAWLVGGDSQLSWFEEIDVEN
ncbi:MAG: carboxymuconolactone decarboxylase family protein [Candidatus Nanohaloarchaea archaeon]|nr:carboxymuconolactone decarboxylase family protein [Candidatus Nanohaloarchaea archaeon]